jgi:hypothetical protein
MTSRNLANLDFDRDIVPLISRALVESGFFGLSDKEVVVLRGSWRGLDYKEMARDSGLKVGHLERHVAKNLFERLSELIGENIQKNTLHKVITALSAAKQEREKPDDLLGAHKIIGTFPNCDGFVERDEESIELAALIKTNRVVFVTGSAGIGKTSLVSNLFRQTEYLDAFQGLVWKYSIDSDIQKNVLDLQRILQLPKNTTLFDFIHDRKILICIDGIDNWFKDESNAKESQAFLRKLIEAQHNSCIVVTIKEPIAVFESLQRSGRLVQSYELKGLSTEESAKLLKKYNLKGTKIDELIASSKGNPQYLHESAQCICRIYGGNIDLFLDGQTSLVLNVIKKNFNFIYSRLQEIDEKERSILAFIASQVQDRSALENDIIERLRKHSGYSISNIVRILNTLKSFNLVSAEESLDPEISVPTFICKYIQLNPDQFPALALPA